MKKVLLLALTTILLCGCGKNEITTKTCSMKEESVNMTFKLTAKNNKINNIILTMEMDNSLYGIESLEILDADKKEQVKTSVLTTLGLDSDAYEGIKINIEINKTMIVTIDADLTKADTEILKKLSMDFTDVDMNLERTIESLTKEGATCK